MSDPRVAIVGGGLAGMSAALACADAGARVTLLEARPRLGGATWSTTRDGLSIDNGQHVFLRCCTAYLQFLRRLGVEDRVQLQDRLAVPVVAPGARTAWLRRHALPAPLHLAPSLLRYRHLGLRDRIFVAQAARRLARLDLADETLDEQTFGAWLARHRQSPEAIERFWDLIARPTLNLPASGASLALAVKVFQTGLLGEPAAADIGFARLPLQRVHAEPGRRALEAAGAQIHLRARTRRIESKPGRAPTVHLGDRTIEVDAVIVAVAHDEIEGLLPEEAAEGASGGGMGSSPIVNLHVVYDRPVLPWPFAAGVGTPVQWVFDRTEASGLERGQYLAVSLSAADAYVGVSSADLRRTFEPELARLFPAARQARLERFFVTCERTATFRQEPGTRRLRPGPTTGVPGLYLAGAWTDTGWPATMEGAVRSGRAAARQALLGMGRSRGIPAEAAA